MRTSTPKLPSPAYAASSPAPQTSSSGSGTPIFGGPQNLAQLTTPASGQKRSLIGGAT